MVRGDRSKPGDEHMTTNWVKIATVRTGYEADAAKVILEEAGIPVLVRGYQPGIFGVGFQGPVIGGISILVPGPAESQARELIDVDVEDDDGGDEDER
jgi:hypothetical protein